MFNPENEVKRILNERPNESNQLDYKAREYSSGRTTDFIKDVVSFLNSIESYGKDKYIILGVNKDKIIGLQKDMYDDNEYQDLLNKITPRPEVRTGQITHNGMRIGFVYIPGSRSKNNKRIYEVAANPPQSENKSIAEGQAYIRRGSTNNLITADERNEIYLERLREGRAANSDILDQIEALKQKTSDDFKSTLEFGIVNYNPNNNNGIYVIGKGERTFSLYWYVTYSNIAHVRTGRNETIGYRNRSKEWPPNYKINLYDFSSLDRKVEQNESFIIVNGLGKIVGIRLLEATSKAHGAEEDKVIFEYSCLN